MTGVEAHLRHYLEKLHAQGAAFDARQPDRLHRRRNLEPDSAHPLWMLMLACGSQSIVEVGTSNGYSTLWWAHAAVRTRGHVVSLDVDPTAQGEAHRHLERKGLRASVDLVRRDAGPYLADLPERCVDFLFLDAERSQYASWWPHPVRVLAAHGLLVVDNASSPTSTRFDLSPTCCAPAARWSASCWTSEKASSSVAGRLEPTAPSISEASAAGGPNGRAYRGRLSGGKNSGRDMAMALPLEDYALLGDTHGSALVGRDGSVDWLCLPRFDSSAVFAALLGDRSAGRWLLAPTNGGTASSWAYRGESLVLETLWRTSSGVARVVECMPPKDEASDLVRVVEGVSGHVQMRVDLLVRFGDGQIVPWARQLADQRRLYVAGPDALLLDTPVPLESADFTTTGTFTVRAGQRIPFVLTHQSSHLPLPAPVHADRAVDEAEKFWSQWMASCTYAGPYDEAVRRSLVVLKALTYAPTGGIVAAPTTSLPEQLGGPRNWDYRYCWLRDATITLLALLEGGFTDEARAWRAWLLRAVAGNPADLQIMYGLAGERRLDERTLPWLAGYEGSAPVRVGNAAVGQRQLDVYGEVIDALHHYRLAGLPAARAPHGHVLGAGDSSEEDAAVWRMQEALLDWLETGWSQPDSGMWEMRGPTRHFTASKVMTWVAVDRCIRSAERFALPAPMDRWHALRATIRDDVFAHGVDPDRGCFTQAYGSRYLDAALLQIPLVGFLPPGDPRVVATVDAVVRDLGTDTGFLLRYDPHACDDGLPGGEGAFLACTFWLAECQALLGRVDDAAGTFERLLDLRTDLGLLAEEYDTDAHRLVGNFPQAFSHVPLITTAAALGRARSGSPAASRRAGVYH